MTATGCSTQKNTAMTRRWHAFKARYNTYYNGTLAYIDASEEKENGNRDNYTEMLPLYTVANKQSRELGKAGYERAIEKCKKTIRQHSIKRRPVWDKKRRKTQRDREWLSRREYNPFLWRAWMLMGRSQFYKGDFDEAASTFAYMSRLYRTQPAIYGKARAWLAKCYVEEGWNYDAEDVIRETQRDSIHWAAQKEWDYTLTDYYLRTADYKNAAVYLRRVIRHEMRRKQRAREWYIMGQIQTLLGNKAAATAAYRRVIRQNPPYEVEFNARIAMTEVMSGSQSNKMIARLKRMAASDKNKGYLDQVYYAIGNIYMARRDTANAISAYERGAARATRSGIEKGVLLLRLGDIYWQRERYADAQRTYGEAIGLLDHDRPDYAQLNQRSKVLDELVPFTETIHLQDSLQQLARMDEASRNAAIDRVIAQLKRKEREEQRLKAEQESDNGTQQNGSTDTGNSNRLNQQRPLNSSTSAAMKGDKTQWYFYNPMAVSQGKTAFRKLWGKRENVDNWRRTNKTVVAVGNNDDEAVADTTELVADSIPATLPDSAVADPHQREYYLAQIPFTDEQKAESDRMIMDALYNAGVIFKDKLDNLTLSERSLLRLIRQYESSERIPDAYYHLFLLYMRKGDKPTADSYVSLLQRNYPHNELTVLLSDPNYVENARFGVHIEDSLYAATYDAFKAGRYNDVKAGVELSGSRFALGANRDKFVFIGGLSKLNDGDAAGCIEDMRTVVEKYPQSGVAPLAGMIVKGVGEGRRLYGGKFDIDNVWQRRAAVLADSDSVATRQLSAERNTPFVYMAVYAPDSVDENRLLFNIARYNFTSYLVRNFDIAIEDVDGLHSMTISGFRNYDEALQYARQLHSQKPVAQLMAHARSVIVSEENRKLLGQQFSYDDYDRFYARHFAPLKISDKPLLNEPDYTPEQQPDDTVGPDVPNVSPVINNDNVNKKVDDKKVDSKKVDNMKVDNKTNKKKENKVVEDLSDEYYDLEGF
ncbi:tetratricopeptide repeat protein [uncultured Prevotella sp.]|uniref:type IX secretion system periplasmic lipoprotein PorW/SprE n=1 Tax=uncultured Prevotella sp. TaxID=159272 RepID=UPI00261EC8D9|nr:tetratricopeptide repeat protein [uncultured Prevotella sp.]